NPSYHGNTLLALSASAREQYKLPFREWLVDVEHIPAPYPYRCGCRGDDPTCPACSGAALEHAIERAGADTVAAFIAEPVGGSSTGASTPRPEYFRTIREICDRYQVLFVADEILCGAGRTGTWWAVDQYGATPDLMTMGKGISGGYAPLSAVAAPPRGGRPGAGPACGHRVRGRQDQPGPVPTGGQVRRGVHRGRAGGWSRGLAQRGARRRRQRRPGRRSATLHYHGAGDRPDRDALHHGAHGGRLGGQRRLGGVPPPVRRGACRGARPAGPGLCALHRGGADHLVRGADRRYLAHR